MLCGKCGEPLAYLTPRADAEPTWVYEYAFGPESDWVAEWTDATVELIADTFADGVDNAVANADEFRGRRKGDPQRWRVCCPRCRRDYRGMTRQLMKLDADTRAAGRRSFTLSAERKT